MGLVVVAGMKPGVHVAMAMVRMAVARGIVMVMFVRMIVRVAPRVGVTRVAVHGRSGFSPELTETPTE